MYKHFGTTLLQPAFIVLEMQDTAALHSAGGLQYSANGWQKNTFATGRFSTRLYNNSNTTKLPPTSFPVSRRPWKKKKNVPC